MSDPQDLLDPARALLDDGLAVVVGDVKDVRPAAGRADVGDLRLEVVELLRGPARYTRGAVVKVGWTHTPAGERGAAGTGWEAAALEPGARLLLAARPTADALVWTAVAVRVLGPAGAAPAPAPPGPAPGPGAAPVPGATPAPGATAGRTLRLAHPAVLAAREALRLAAARGRPDPEAVTAALADEDPVLRGVALAVCEAAGRDASTAWLARAFDRAGSRGLRQLLALHLLAPARFVPERWADRPNTLAIGAIARRFAAADDVEALELASALLAATGSPCDPDPARDRVVRRALLAIADAPHAEVAARAEALARRAGGPDRAALEEVAAAWRGAAAWRASVP